MDGIGLSHSRAGELTYIDLSGLCQGDECLISIRARCRIPQSIDFETHPTVRCEFFH